MRTYEIGIVIEGYKTILVEAEDEEDASEKLYEICKSNTIPIVPEEDPDIVIDYVEEVADEPILTLTEDETNCKTKGE